jgi:hypothetical protein
MTELTQAGSAQPDWSAAAPIAVRPADLLAALATFALSCAVLAYAMSHESVLALVLLLHLAVLALPAWMLWRSVQAGRDLTVRALLLITTAVAGPIGALGSLLLALALWRHAPRPWRLQHWYDYISGVVARRRVARLYDELISGRLPPDPAAAVPRFNPILHDTSLEDQQRVLAVIGRRYHPDFRATLRRAMRHKNGFIRAQAAAIASRLSPEERARLWSVSPQEEAKRSLDEGAPPS